MAVTKDDIYDALRGKEERLDISDWRRMVGLYPYCEIFVWHYLRALYKGNDVSFDGELQRLGIRLGDKQGFYNFMVKRPMSESLFTYKTETTDYFAGHGEENLSLTELARRLRTARLAQKESFCTATQEKNDIREPLDEARKEVSEPLEEVQKAKKKHSGHLDEENGQDEDSAQDSNYLQVIRAKVSSLIMQKKYSEALEILKRENFANSKKNAYFAVQIKYLETIIKHK
ncbi:MAG: hypothetical protein MJ002_01720 [Paludibacteraceae bacterium]|nr:hypothetical protein [Paludibacteraceae bacterium]